MAKPLIGAIEAGGTKFVLALMDEAGRIVAEQRIATLTAAETMPEVIRFFSEAPSGHGELAAIGVASFGPLDIDPASPTYGTITTTPKPGWSGASFIDWLRPLGVPLKVDTDVNGAALGEALSGAGKGCRTLAYTTVGTGIGTGVVRDLRPMAGFSHYESGHIPVAHDRARDPFDGLCPYHGDCLEGLAAGPAIRARFGDSLDAMADPAPAVALISGYLADLATNLVLLHAPDRLVFGGGVMKAPGLIPALRRETARRLAGYVAHLHDDPELEHYIVSPGLGDEAGITGAAELARQAIAQRDAAA
ncbi:ROK family protein [Novosphingobium flavum]|uniref:fructokinase n=1 Tax=Novosphingobium flavum TaxID=1778672 RepID=A0A7X1KLT7_9SPHN|nr:ROK family protein [Novosphingobium flavum]MBC2665936.1 ROK family protein [Novosphingobium flavum]